jgi:hypothetical protein
MRLCKGCLLRRELIHARGSRLTLLERRHNAASRCGAKQRKKD